MNVRTRLRVSELTVRLREQMREQRREDLDKHVAEFNAELRKQNPDLSDLESDAEVVDSGKQEEWEGIDENESVAQEDEYVDEDKYTTVTVEPMGGMSEEDEDQDTRHSTQAAAHGDKGTAGVTKKRPWSKSASDANGVSKPKPKKKKFRYESKAERAMTRKKQKSKSHAAKAKREGK